MKEQKAVQRNRDRRASSLNSCGHKIAWRIGLALLCSSHLASITVADDESVAVATARNAGTGIPAQGVQGGRGLAFFSIGWSSSNGGGRSLASSTAYSLSGSAAQSITGPTASAQFSLTQGYWVAESLCPVAKTGDVNISGDLTSADIIYLVNYVFKGQAAPQPCEAAGDVNCSGSVTSADVIYLVNHVFKAQVGPCDVCSLIPGTWSCP